MVWFTALNPAGYPANFWPDLTWSLFFSLFVEAFNQHSIVSFNLINSVSESSFSRSSFARLVGFMYVSG